MRLRATAKRDAISSIELAVFGITYGQVVQPLPGGPDMSILLLGIWAQPFLRRGDPYRVDTGAARPPEGRGFVGINSQSIAFLPLGRTHWLVT